MCTLVDMDIGALYHHHHHSEDGEKAGPKDEAIGDWE